MAESVVANPTAKLTVCERTGRWATALRRELADSGIRIWETRTPADCFRELQESPASFVVVELLENTKSIDGLFRLLAAARRYPAARVAVVLERSMVSWEAALREAGVVHIAQTPRGAGLLARLACRHLAQIPPLSQTLTERIWANLPWRPPSLS